MTFSKNLKSIFSDINIATLTFFWLFAWDKEGYYIRENICKQSNWQKINLQNIQAAHVAQFKKNGQGLPW